MLDRANSRNADLLARAKKVMPGGCLGSVFLDDEVDLVVVRGEGAHVYDADGNKYVDYVLGSGPMILGHRHPAVSEALKTERDSPTNFYLVNDTAVQLAETIVDAVPCADSVKFCVTGSEATFYALRLARAATRRNKILKFEGGFHGGHDYAMMSTQPSGTTAFPAAIPDSAGTPAVLSDHVLIAPYNDLNTTVRIMETYRDELAAVIVEPQSRLIDPAPGFLEGLREATTRMGALLIFDEVVTGFRLAYGGAQERYGVAPDLAAYGKIIGGGMPLGCVAGRRDIMELCNPRTKNDHAYAYMSGTFSGNRMATTAGLATLQVLAKPGVYDHLNRLGARLRDGLCVVADRAGVPVQPIGSGPVGTVCFTATPVVDYRSSMAADKVLSRKVANALIRRGSLVRMEKLYVSLAHTEADIDGTIGAFEDALNSIQQGRE